MDDDRYSVWEWRVTGRAGSKINRFNRYIHKHERHHAKLAHKAVKDANKNNNTFIGHGTGNTVEEAQRAAHADAISQADAAQVNIQAALTDQHFRYDIRESGWQWRFTTQSDRRESGMTRQQFVDGARAAVRTAYGR